MDVRIEGLNGKLPNLDMFNLVQRIMAREGIASGYKQAPRKKRRHSQSVYEQNLRGMLSMLASQASGVPTGNHGLFHRYRIDALTIAAARRQTHATLKGNPGSAAVPLLKAIEGISRSLNNLLERFHQSFFFYVIVNNDRYISIGDYMPALVALVACAFVKAYLKWATLPSASEMEAAAAAASATGSESELPAPGEAEPDEPFDLPYGSVLIYLVATLAIGYLCNVLPLQQYFLEIPMGAAPLTTSVLSFLSLIGFILPFVVVLPPGGLELLHVAFLLIYGCAMIAIGLLNFALGFFVAVLTVPLVISLETSEENTKSSFRNSIRLLTLILNPMMIVYVIVLAMTFYQFPELPMQKIMLRAATAAMDASAYGLIDSVVSVFWGDYSDGPFDSCSMFSRADLWKLPVLCRLYGAAAPVDPLLDTGAVQEAGLRRLPGLRRGAFAAVSGSARAATGQAEEELNWAAGGGRRLHISTGSYPKIECDTTTKQSGRWWCARRRTRQALPSEIPFKCYAFD